MRELFVDTSYLIALFDHRDPLFSKALARGRELGSDQVTFLATHLVVAEFLAHFSRSRRDLRVGAADYIREFTSRSDVTVIPLTAGLVGRALDLYRARGDKQYSLTDCVSMIVCRDRGITEVLTSDTDFEHEGFTILLKA